MAAFTGFGTRLNELEVITNPHIPGVWEFPKERFFEYEPKDESWCRLLGIGKEVFPTVYRVGNQLHMHPKTWEEFSKELGKAPSESQLRWMHQVGGAYLGKEKALEVQFKEINTDVYSDLFERIRQRNA
jgi:hypothetical protein